MEDALARSLRATAQVGDVWCSWSLRHAKRVQVRVVGPENIASDAQAELAALH
jgi:hypothetical protein